MSIDEKLNLILKNQKILNENQLVLYAMLNKGFRSDTKDFVLNYVADIASMLSVPDNLNNK